MSFMRPIFIGGSPRSGTTLLGSLLGGHSRIACVPESEFFGIASRIVSPQENISGEAIDSIVNHWRFRYWGLERRVFLRGVQRDSTLRTYIESIVSAYSRDVPIDLWVDHTPNNLHFISTLFQHFPDGLAIHIIRDPRAVAASIIPLDWGPNTPQDAADLWIRETGIGLAAKEYFPDRVLSISYASLITETEHQLRKICEFVNIDFESVLLENTGFTVPRYSRKQHALVGKAPDRSRIDAWRTRLKDREIEIIESRTYSMMANLGYTDFIHRIPRPVRWHESMVCHFKDIMWQKWIHKFRLNQRKNE